jgi:hypothetical protein
MLFLLSRGWALSSHKWVLPTGALLQSSRHPDFQDSLPKGVDTGDHIDVTATSLLGPRLGALYLRLGFRQSLLQLTRGSFRRLDFPRPLHSQDTQSRAGSIRQQSDRVPLCLVSLAREQISPVDTRATVGRRKCPSICGLPDRCACRTPFVILAVRRTEVTLSRELRRAGVRCA